MSVERKQSKNPRLLGLTDKEDRFCTSSLQCIDAVNIQQLPQKLYLNEIIYNPAMFKIAKHSKEFSFKFPELSRMLKPV